MFAERCIVLFGPNVLSYTIKTYHLPFTMQIYNILKPQCPYLSGYVRLCPNLSVFVRILRKMLTRKCIVLLVVSEVFCIFESALSFRTERSGVKNLDGIHLCALEILRFALDDNTDKSTL